MAEILTPEDEKWLRESNWPPGTPVPLLLSEVDRLRGVLAEIEPLIDAQFEGHSNIKEFMEKAVKLNRVLDLVREALKGTDV